MQRSRWDWPHYRPPRSRSPCDNLPPCDLARVPLISRTVTLSSHLTRIAPQHGLGDSLASPRRITGIAACLRRLHFTCRRVRRRIRRRFGHRFFAFGLLRLLELLLYERLHATA